MTDLERTKYLRNLRRKIVECFDLAELKALAFDLSIDWDTLPGDEKLTKVQSLIMHLARRGILNDLITLLKEERPNIDWPEIPPAQQQIEDEGEIIPDSVREAALQDYLDKMNRYVVGKKLSDNENYNEATIATARAYTESIISRLDKSRLAIIIKLLGDLNIFHQIFLNANSLNLTDVNLDFANMSKALLNGINFAGANLRYADMRRTYLRNANLEGADLESANLVGAMLDEANLKDANLCAANLGNAFLPMVNLSRANLTATSMEKIDLSMANLFEANMRGAKLCGADLRGANLQKADLFMADLSNVLYDNKTIWPDDFDKSKLEK